VHKSTTEITIARVMGFVIFIKCKINTYYQNTDSIVC
jgi:hypothetical protein